ncbi:MULTISPECIES: phage holin family protein [unclassified Gilliamella]|uniref:phage holin family protein n=1 Tax=unclassified Gilliamella TaxID=2685620 RepID=UPI0018DDAD81|nr:MULTISPECIES: phage holin family protein [unclassified Gilliamella]MBI0029328.1 phage holin family protein [Gilliamella sp. B14448G7]MBI0030586.1 phage holin family protein [Gilliamella sp. B14384G15]MBI0036240.1 phage holin family protein [Gilliamella sp. B14448G11]MBI0042770.1 phage holin family protein [Gilliamella sp. B14448G12]MBI0057882.1 phage holin family protein [Gilliamella sp. B14384G12]
MITTLNAIFCLMIAVRLFTFDRNNCRYKVRYSWLAWLMIISSATISLFSFFNLPHRAYLAQVVMNITLLLCLLKSKGNISTFCRSSKSVKNTN